MGVFVVLPLVLPLTAWPISRLAERRLHPRTATIALTAVGAILALCSTLCLALLVVVGTAQLPGNPLPDGWAAPEVRAAVPYDENVGIAAIGALTLVATACGSTLWRHYRVRNGAWRALDGLPTEAAPAAAAAQAVAAGAKPQAGAAAPVTGLTVLPDQQPYAYALPGRSGPGRIVVSDGMLAGLAASERRALLAHERAHLAGRHHRYLLASRLTASANPFLRPLRTAVAFSAERWADEDAARQVGSRRVVATAVGKAALLSGPALAPSIASFAAAGPVPRRIAALLGPMPSARLWPPADGSLCAAALIAAAGTAASALSSLNAAVALFVVLTAATPL
ncbi:M56 family metallopeptidase [Streptomyces zagrosensis]|uniref:Zn-dependent protease with chaperone function n=1 Tax=Streptomyces zagrosensis TaxID=1042984 RepID=A0A7W9Q5B9_9ACTN|nr:M56 family metallopeptidase [Streptomyces zagrosensis]MBB5933935.1 Zn-dependent protease with chaperone function [Streptomyces zagrosensis]